MGLCAIKENFREEVTRGRQVPSGSSASARHRAHFHHSPDHAGWPLPVGLCARLPPRGRPPGPGAKSGKCVSLGPGLGGWLSHAPRGHKHPCGLRTPPARVFLCAGFLSTELMTPPPPRPGGSVCPALRTLFYRLCLRSGVGPALSRRPPPCCVSENRFKSHGSAPFANLLTGRLLIIITELAVLSEAVGSLGPASRLPRRARGAILSDPSRKSFIQSSTSAGEDAAGACSLPSSGLGRGPGSSHPQGSALQGTALGDRNAPPRSSLHQTPELSGPFRYPHRRTAGTPVPLGMPPRGKLFPPPPGSDLTLGRLPTDVASGFSVGLSAPTRALDLPQDQTALGRQRSALLDRVLGRGRGLSTNVRRQN